MRSRTVAASRRRPAAIAATSSPNTSSRYASICSRLSGDIDSRVKVSAAALCEPTRTTSGLRSSRASRRARKIDSLREPDQVDRSGLGQPQPIGAARDPVLGLVHGFAVGGDRLASRAHGVEPRGAATRPRRSRAARRRSAAAHRRRADRARRRRARAASRADSTSVRARTADAPCASPRRAARDARAARTERGDRAPRARPAGASRAAALPPARRTTPGMTPISAATSDGATGSRPSRRSRVATAACRAHAPC